MKKYSVYFVAILLVCGTFLLLWENKQLNGRAATPALSERRIERRLQPRELQPDLLPKFQFAP